ncbi:YfhO family protein [Senegalimassilia anaerobia]|uniref:YfhO family protein n=1 Tax=Senegalimassilia anaerobia TaxID=1473216 RepID=UPI002E7A268C|nr:YfhO family protein [Senegalimassilia anaerobia]MEE0227298.1 YfhO family protein [Senegalimassilia anaerobia]
MYISGNDAPEQPHQRLTARTRASRFARTAAPYLAAFAIPFCVLLAAFAMRGIYPFGDVSVMLYDMPVQYAEYFGWLIQVLHGQGNLLYSNAAGLGGGMFSLFTYYLSSPFNLIAFFFTPETVPQLFSVLYLVKIPACAVGCLVLLRGRLLAADAESWREARTAAASAPAGRQALLVLFACAYALTSYVLGYASNIMWLDGVIMAPLAALGAYRLVQRRACGGLFATCACAIVFNWYTGYMVCLLCVLWFFYELARGRSLRGRRLRRCWLFAATMVLAVGAGMVVLIPTALSLLGGKGTHAGLASLACNTGLARNPLAVADLFCIGTLPGITTQANLPALTISALVLVGVGMFLANGAIGRRERIAGAAFALVMATSLVLTPVATIWSGFVPESSYTNRNGFAILLVMTMLAAEGLLALSRLDARQRRGCALLGGGAALVSVAGSAAWLYMAKGSLPQAPELMALECGLLAAFTLLVAGGAGMRGIAAGPDGKSASDTEAEQIGGKTGSANLEARATHGKVSPSPARTDSLPHGPQPILRTALCVALVCVFIGEQVFSAQAQLSRCRYTVSGYTDTLTELESFYSQLEGATAGSEAVSDSKGDSDSDESKVNDVSGVGSAAADDADGVSAFARVGNAAPYWGGSKANGPDNMALVLGVSTFDHYSSTQEYRIQQLLHDLGYSKVTPFGTYYMSSNVIADALLGVTDIVDDQPPAAAEPEEAVLRGTWRAYRNELALPLGWGTTGSAHVDWQEGRPLDNQDAMLADAADNDASALSAVDVQECDGDQDARTYTLTPSADGPVYLYTPTAFVNDLYYEGGIVCELRVDGSLVQTIGGRGSCNQVYLGWGRAGQSMQVAIKPLAEQPYELRFEDGTVTNAQSAFWDVPANELMQAGTVDLQILENQLSRVDSAGFALTAYENGRIAATFNAAQDETLVISQPYEDGWTATVNGKPAEVQAAYDGLMGIPVQTGDNVIELHYLTPGLVPGAVVGIASVTLFAVWRIAARRRSMLRDGE